MILSLKVRLRLSRVERHSSGGNRAVDVLAEIKRLTGGSADVASEALGTRFSLDEIPRAYQLYGDRSDGVLKVAIKP